MNEGQMGEDDGNEKLYIRGRSFEKVVMSCTACLRAPISKLDQK